MYYVISSYRGIFPYNFKKINFYFNLIKAKICFDFFNSFKLFNVIIYYSKYSIYPEKNYYICYSWMEYL